MKPILFNTEMVRAILDGRKTVTRRLLKGYALEHLQIDTDGSVIGVYDQHEGCVRPVTGYAPCQPGDILYVRETWCNIPVSPGGHFRPNGVNYYKADGDERPDAWKFAWKPSIHMPKEAARLFLRVTDVRAEQLQDIDGLGAFNEGAVAEMPGACFPPTKPRGFDGWSKEKQNDHIRSMATSAYIAKLEFADRLIKAFSKIWDSTIKAADLGKYGWEANPWVWVIEFERISKEEAYRWPIDES